MNIKKAAIAVPLSLSLLLPVAANSAAAHDHATPTVSDSAVDLRATLDQLLSEHVYLAVETMRKGVDGSKDFDQSAAALQGNTEDLSAAIASVYGDEAGAKFKEMWSAHIGFFVDYVKGTAGNDEAAKKAALDELAQYKEDFSNFLSTATEKRLEADALAEGLQMHVDQLVGAFNAYVAGDYEKAYEYEREAIHHMYMVSKGLSNAIVMQFPDKFENHKAVTPAADLRSDLNYLLSEHAGLAVTAMQNGIDGSKDFEASAAALSANTEDLSAAIASVYGKEAGEQFKQMWAEHIGHFVSYVKATGANDEEAKKAALTALAQYKDSFAKFLETATGGRLPADALAEGLQMHVDQLVKAFDTYTAEDYANTYPAVREAYGHMFETSKGLSGAIVDQFPDKFKAEMPSEMPKTGMGGTAAQGLPFEAILISAILALAAAGFVTMRRLAADKK
ncbi:copper amine oxidase [Mesobacillus sp. AQ2]|uniref:copper amine oxidase n=1 Tax=Mesobacillus sp. AQ2 TaxID=3043332 RepID=UPI0024C116CF|nr:copper amine oxidase [Mesobacillus sp. AQ2]WHX41291.1 copper amine oxidase [Mesobacillus sp. AQ2]